MSNTDLASWVFGSASLLYLAGIATYLAMRRRDDHLVPAASFILGFLCAIAGGFCTYFFTGKLGLEFQVPSTNINGNAAGGIGVFVLVMLLWLRTDKAAANERLINVSAKVEADRQTAEEKAKVDEQKAAERAQKITDQSKKARDATEGLLGRKSSNLS